jgi:hypothetical protein
MSTFISARRVVGIAALFFLISLAAVAAAQNGDPTQQQVMDSLGYRFWIVIVAAIFAFLSRFVLLRRLNKLMLSPSKKAEEHSFAETVTTEVTAHQKLNVVELDIQSEQAPASPGRARLAQQASKAINRVFVSNLIIGVVYVASYYFILGGDDVIADLEISVNESNFDQTLSSIKLIGGYKFLIYLFLIWNVMRFVGDRNRLSAYTKGPLGFLKPVATFILKFFHTAWCQALAVMVLLYTLLLMTLWQDWLLAVAIVTHLSLWYLLKMSGRRQMNSKLLILRVFLIGKTSAFTFKSLAKLWRHFGTYFTVADPSFYKVTWKQRFNYTFPLYIVILFFVYTLVTDTNKDAESEIFAAFFFLLLAGNILFVIVNRIRMKQNFMSNATALDKKLKKLELAPTKFDNTFKEQPVMCYDNTWKQAVDGLVDSADVILMDLRGFSETNKGCAYEINVLFDSVLANRVVFMGYKDAVGLIRNVIEEQWQELSDKSPNLNFQDPYTTLYTVNKENNREVEIILGVLLDAVALPSKATQTGS